MLKIEKLCNPIIVFFSSSCSVLNHFAAGFLLLLKAPSNWWGNDINQRTLRGNTTFFLFKPTQKLNPDPIKLISSFAVIACQSPVCWEEQSVERGWTEREGNWGNLYQPQPGLTEQIQVCDSCRRFFVPLSFTQICDSPPPNPPLPWNPLFY